MIISLLRTARHAAAALLVLTGLAASAHAITVDEIIANKKFVVGVLTESPPYSFLDEKQEPTGYDIDVAKLVAGYLGVELEFVKLNPQSRIPYLLTNKIDAVFTIFGILPERVRQVAFTNPYSSSDISIFAAKSIKLETPADLAPLRVSVARGSSQERAVVAIAPKGTKILRFDSNGEEIQAVITGQADVLIGVKSIFDNFTKAAPQIELERKITLTTQYNGVGVRKQDTELLQFLNTVLFYAQQNGELDAIYRKWFDEPLPQLPRF
jgi:polar amino acid transport system substrate-binding protein